MGKPILFGNYYLLERINVGGMAEVFKAKAIGVEGFERLVAVKRILPNIAEDQEFIGMFIDEAKIAVQLTHANIAQIFDLGKVAESYFIALEYVPGKDLRAIFNHARQRGEPVPMAMACYTIMKVCEALDYAHNKRDANGNPLHFVHRDVSPQNILISYEGEIKVIDFGIAKAAGKASKTRAGILKGKFGYMSPEQVHGADIDKRSDVFGVGICLYELLTGERLFTGESDFSTVEKVRKVDIMPPSTYNRRIPEELEQIALKALARNREDRYQTALELHDDLQSFTFTSGNTFGRKDLSAYMRKVFADEIEQEAAHDREYSALNLNEIKPSFASPDPETANPFGGPLRSEAGVRDEPNYGTPKPGPTLPPPRRRVATLLGMPILNPGENSLKPPLESKRPEVIRKVSVPPLVPGRQSIPPRYIPPATSTGSIDWDDEDMSTQIYDRPDGASPLDIPLPTPLYTGEQADEIKRSQELVVSAPAGPRAAEQASRAPRIEDSFPLPSIKPKRTVSTAQYIGMVFAAAAVVVSAIVVAMLALPSEPKVGIIHLTTMPKDALVTLDLQPVVGSSSPFIITNVKPKVKHTIEVSKTGYENASLEVAVEPDQIKQLSEIVLRPLESGFTLDSTPSNAKVFVDGKELAQGTPINVTALTAGAHQVRVEQEGYAPWETQIHVTAGLMLDLPVARLVPKGPLGRTPKVQAKNNAEKAPSEASARASTPPSRRQVVLFAKGVLRINTRPWSQVFVDGKLIGNTPQMNIELEPGHHRITLVNAEFHIQKSLDIEIPAGETVVKILDLIPNG